jgi:hypothetical protein
MDLLHLRHMETTLYRLHRTDLLHLVMSPVRVPPVKDLVTGFHRRDHHQEKVVLNGHSHHSEMKTVPLLSLRIGRDAIITKARIPSIR